MDARKEHNEQLRLFKEITGIAMKVHSRYRPGLIESAYEAAMEYLLKLNGHQVERQKLLHTFWEDVQLEQTYKMDLVVDGIIVELKAVSFISTEHRRQLQNYMNLTHSEYGMLINFGAKSLYSEWYRRNPVTGDISQVRLL